MSQVHDRAEPHAPGTEQGETPRAGGAGALDAEAASGPRRVGVAGPAFRIPVQPGSEAAVGTVGRQKADVNVTDAAACTVTQS